MATTYRGTNYRDVVTQNYQHDYLNIYTYGGNDAISLVYGATYVEAGYGNDYVKSSVEGDNDIYLGAGADTYVGNGSSKNTNYFDIVYGEGGDDKFTIKTNVSEYYGGTGNDQISSAGYRNYFDGGDGVDTISYMAQDTDQFLKGTGVIVDLREEYATTGSDRVETVIDFENIKGTSYGDTLRGDGYGNMIWGMGGYDALNGRDGNDVIHGNNGDDDLYGGNNNDRLYGDEQADRLFGQNGNDRLEGGWGNDRLNGGAGKDAIVAGRGQDLMAGGGGVDSFIFASVADSVNGTQRDVIFDFTHGIDLINLAQIDAVEGGGNNAFRYIGGANFQQAGDLQYRNHILAGDVDGDGSADFQIRLQGVDALTAGDFIL